MEYEMQKAAYNPGTLGALAGGNANAIATAAPRTIATALSGMDKLVERLANVRGAVGHLCETIGGPYPASGQIKGDRPPSSGAVGRLNDSADHAHSILSEIEQLLSAVGRSLG